MQKQRIRDLETHEKNEEMKRMKEWHHKTLYIVYDGKKRSL